MEGEGDASFDDPDGRPAHISKFSISVSVFLSVVLTVLPIEMELKRDEDESL